MYKFLLATANDLAIATCHMHLYMLLMVKMTAIYIISLASCMDSCTKYAY